MVAVFISCAGSTGPRTLLGTILPLATAWGNVVWWWKKASGNLRYNQRANQCLFIPPLLKGKPKKRWKDNECCDITERRHCVMSSLWQLNNTQHHRHFPINWGLMKSLCPNDYNCLSRLHQVFVLPSNLELFCCLPISLSTRGTRDPGGTWLWSSSTNLKKYKLQFELKKTIHLVSQL